MNNREYRIRLYEIYGDLLTSKQQKYFELYYYEDLSLGEIAENNSVTRQAVQAALSKIMDNLEKFESVLKLEAGAKEMLKGIEAVTPLIAGSPYRNEILKILMKMKG